MNIHDYVFLQKNKLKQILRDLVAIPSVMGESSPEAPFGEEPKNALLKMQSCAEEMGFTVTNYENAVLCVDYLPNPDAEIELGILAHLDVVPAEGDGWETNPFELTEKDGVLYGRGVIDDKGPAVAALMALKCIMALGIPLKKGVRLIFGTNEENGSEDLEIYERYAKFPPKVFTPDGQFPVINVEKGMMRSRFYTSFGKLETYEDTHGSNIVEFSGGNAPNAVPDKAEAVLNLLPLEAVKEQIAADKSGAVFEAVPDGENVRITCRGKAAHASAPETGINAVTALIALINRLELGNQVQGGILYALERFFPHGETDGGALGLKCADESGEATAVLSVFKMRDGKCAGYIDVRFPTCTNLNEVEEKTRYSFERRANLNLELLIGNDPHVVSPDSEFVKKLLAVYEKVEGEPGSCLAIGGGTYVHNIDGGVAFGAERVGTDYHMHGDNEFVPLVELLKDAELFACAIAEICG